MVGPGGNPFRWRWGRIARACLQAGSARGSSPLAARLPGRAPLIVMIGALALRDLSRPDSLIRQVASGLLKTCAKPFRTTAVDQSAGPALLSSPDSAAKSLPKRASGELPD